MTFPSSAHSEEHTSDALSSEELASISGGIALPSLPFPPRFPLPGPKFGPFNCLTCVQGVPRNLLIDVRINPVLKSPFAGL